MKLVTFIGSRRESGFTTAIGRYVSDLMSQRRFEIVEWHPELKPLPIADPTFEPESMENPDDTVRWLTEQVRDCDAMIWASPVYHNSYSAVLKNALDSVTQKYFAGKVVGLLSNNGNRTTHAVDHLRIVARGVGAHATVQQVCVSRHDFEKTDTGLRLVSEGIQTRAERFADELATVTEALRK